MMTIYFADCIGQAGNCLYPHRAEIGSKEDLERAVSRDYVCAQYRGNYRSNGNFMQSDCLAADCDNDHSEDEDDWVWPADVAEAFPGVRFAVHYSRNHMKEKGSRPARPKFHVLFPIPPVTDATAYGDMKKRVCEIFPFFDANALDAARFFFGTDPAQVDLFPGSRSLTEFLEEEAMLDHGLGEGTGEDFVIPEGRRNSTLSRCAGKILKRFGDNAEARAHFDALAEKCVPPLEQKELDSIWKSGRRFYHDKIAGQTDYVPPEKYKPEHSLKPLDYSDVGQATVLAREYGEKLRYSPATDYIVYNGVFWEESRPKSQALAQELTDRQMKEAENEMQSAIHEMTGNGAWQLVSSMGPKRAKAAFSEEQKASFQSYEDAAAFRAYVIKRRDSKYISAALQEGRPKLEIDQKELDRDEFLLNTPSGTYDLRLGLAGKREHQAKDFITKVTAVDPSSDGAELWHQTLDTLFLGDEDLKAYVQEIVGLAAIGKVFIEALIIAYGEGRNGKSTFWNTIARVLGTYSGNMSADTLTVGCKRNVKPEMAETRGKRLIIASELEEGVRLNNSYVKQLCSTDEIFAEKKYRDPFSFVPSHSMVLYTNYLPKVGAIDTGTWRRLIVIPFNAKIEGDSDIKNYADHLFCCAGGAILSWIIEGAKRVIDKQYRISQPQVVQEAIASYRDNNDWLGHFLEECCEVGIDYSAPSGKVYNAYREFCQRSGEYTRSTTDFYAALESVGNFARRRTSKANMLFGLRLKDDFLE
jgi:P4 family phage/plasmid primase-like protien